MIPSPASQGGGKRDKFAYVYLLRSVKHGTFYLGWTTNLVRRLEQHNTSGAGYTCPRGPWELIAYEIHPRTNAAKKRERTLKRNPRMRFFFTKRALGIPRGSAMGGPRQVMG